MQSISCHLHPQLHRFSTRFLIVASLSLVPEQSFNCWFNRFYHCASGSSQLPQIVSRSPHNAYSSGIWNSLVFSQILLIVITEKEASCSGVTLSTEQYLPEGLSKILVHNSVNEGITKRIGSHQIWCVRHELGWKCTIAIKYTNHGYTIWRKEYHECHYHCQNQYRHLTLFFTSYLFGTNVRSRNTDSISRPFSHCS